MPAIIHATTTRMSHASQPKAPPAQPSGIETITNNPLFSDVDFGFEAIAKAKAFGPINAHEMESAFEHYMVSNYHRYDSQAHEELDQEMLRSVKPFIEEIQSAVLAPQLSNPNDVFIEDQVPFVSGTFVLMVPKRKYWEIRSMPWLQVQQALAKRGEGANICHHLEDTKNKLIDDDEPYQIALWFTSLEDLSARFMVCALHPNGAAATYVLCGGQWAKGPPSLLPFEMNGEEIEALTIAGEEWCVNKHFEEELLFDLRQFLPMEKAHQAKDALLDNIISWHDVMNRGTVGTQIELAIRNSSLRLEVDGQKAELLKMRKKHEDAERKLRKSAGRVAELEKELDCLRGKVARNEEP